MFHNYSTGFPQILSVWSAVAPINLEISNMIDKARGELDPFGMWRRCTVGVSGHHAQAREAEED